MKGRNLIYSLLRDHEKVRCGNVQSTCQGEISSSTIRRLKAGESVSTNTLDALCKILNYCIDELVEYIPDTK